MSLSSASSSTATSRLAAQSALTSVISSSLSSVPSPTQTASQSNGSTATASSLYLYTFLATLVLLLSVSAAIVLRSMALRIRHRRLVEEAIRNGTYIPPNQRPGVRASDKPVIYDVYIKDGVDLEKWGDLLPVSAGVAQRSPSTPSGLPGVALPLLQPPALPERAHRFLSRVLSPRRTSAATPDADVPLTPPAPEPRAVGVTVFIAMPSQARGAQHGHPPLPSSSAPDAPPGEKTEHHDACAVEPDLPHIEFGLTQLQLGAVPPVSANPGHKGSGGDAA